MRVTHSDHGYRGPRKTFGPKRRFPREPYEKTAPDAFVQRIGAEDVEAFFSPLKSQLREDAEDTKD